MSERKYASDYRLEERMLPNGKIRMHRIYQGSRFRFRAEPQQVRRTGVLLLAAAALGLALLMPLLWNNSAIGRTVYVILPAAFLLLPLYQVAMVGVRMLRSADWLTRQQRDLTQGRLRSMPVVWAVLAAGALAGCLVYWFWKDLQAGEWLSVAALLLELLLALGMLSCRTRADAEELPPE